MKINMEEMLTACSSLLYVYGIISLEENEKIRARIAEWIGKVEVKPATPPSVNSVWHDVSEVPANGQTSLVDTETCGTHILGPNIDENTYKELVKEFGIIRWAYVSDLLPERKEEEK